MSRIKNSRPMSSPLIKAEGIAKVYFKGSTKIQALRGVDLTVQPGDFVAVMGPSGSGKSTLLHILGCLSRPTSGSYFLDNRDVSGLSDNELSRIRGSQIGFVFQMYNLVPQLSILENVTLPFLYREDEMIKAEARAQMALERVGLAERGDHRPSELSGGELQRAAIARALAAGPDVVLADEPTGNLDSKTSDGVMNLFQELNEQGVTIIVVTHDPGISDRCRSITRIKDGLIVP